MRPRSMFGLLLCGPLALAGLGVAVAGGLTDASMPGPTRHGRPEHRLDQNEDCVACHLGIAEEWAGSMHRQSLADPMVQAALAREHDPEFCRSCHVPEADPRVATDPRRAEVGVGCVGCHLVDDAILAAPGQDDPAMPHQVQRKAAFAGPQACAGCHEFGFPTLGRAGNHLSMQRTVTEHGRSGAYASSCQDCHMLPSETGGALHRSHRFAVASEPRMLRSAAHVEAERQGQAVRMTLEPRTVGHAFPTGDLFRRLLVRLESDDDRCTAQRYLSRHFGIERLDEGIAIKVELSDDRVGVGPGPRTVDFDLPPHCAALELRWAVVYQRVLDVPGGAEADASVWDQTQIASGTLAGEPTP